MISDESAIRLWLSIFLILARCSRIHGFFRLTNSRADFKDTRFGTATLTPSYGLMDTTTHLARILCSNRIGPTPSTCIVWELTSLFTWGQSRPCPPPPASSSMPPAVLLSSSQLKKPGDFADVKGEAVFPPVFVHGSYYLSSLRKVRLYKC